MRTIFVFLKCICLCECFVDADLVPLWSCLAEGGKYDLWVRARESTNSELFSLLSYATLNENEFDVSDSDMASIYFFLTGRQHLIELVDSIDTDCFWFWSRWLTNLFRLAYRIACHYAEVELRDSHLKCSLNKYRRFLFLEESISSESMKSKECECLCKDLASIIGRCVNWRKLGF